jgi:hypothetical protein
MKNYECFWGTGYRDADNKSIMAYHDEEFFTEDRGYSELLITWVKGLEIGEQVDISDISGDHWVRRVK